MCTWTDKWNSVHWGFNGDCISGWISTMIVHDVCDWGRTEARRENSERQRDLRGQGGRQGGTAGAKSNGLIKHQVKMKSRTWLPPSFRRQRMNSLKISPINVCRDLVPTLHAHLLPLSNIPFSPIPAYPFVNSQSFQSQNNNPGWFYLDKQCNESARVRLPESPNKVHNPTA